MAGQGNALEQLPMIFSDDELNQYLNVIQCNSELCEIEGGCTNKKFGDTIGHLRIFVDGKLEIICHCSDRCKNELIMSGFEFVKHVKRSGKTANSWKNHIWVVKRDGNRVKLSKTCLLRHHQEPYKRPVGDNFHRDEFLQCTRCGKERRFSLRTKEECRLYHHMFLDSRRTCYNMFQDETKSQEQEEQKTVNTRRVVRITCDDEEERPPRKACRGCPVKPRCRGCERCVCVGCKDCRYKDCCCSICVDFYP